MTTTPTYPVGMNTHVQAFNKGGLVIDFSRNPRDFKVNQYMQIVPVQKQTDFYLRMTLEEAARILNSSLADNAWGDGNDRPSGFGNAESFGFEAYRCERYFYPVTLGQLAIEHAAWDVKAQHIRIVAQQAMTKRSVKAITEMTTAANYDSTHTSAVSAISGNTGTWAASTTTRGDIQRSLNYAANIIQQDTFSTVTPEMLQLVISPGCALKLGVSQEIKDYMKGSYEAGKLLRGEANWRNRHFNIPDNLYGYEVIVEDTVKVTSRKGATRVTSYAMPDASPFMCARVGGLEGIAGAPNFSTGVLFVYSPDDMAEIDEHDSKNRRTDLGVVDNFQAKLIAPVSGFLFTSAV